ncbi:Fumarate hydratase 2, chloroplastic [Fusarium venenatum]|uniref:fumarate hydratase n=1 Tax=Fusarium venenatum TaxID=56646 RepID=A0A2L2SSS7_9HYPO|nr:uncharacterized protein FVRRES_04690 [Fusarium venenatum]KAG8355707.1 Fumarate hydratase 2, chloroplastic [Fusarium venenatum]CEI60254.1 unnamed protein product [Fusarium venenatum]
MSDNVQVEASPESDGAQQLASQGEYRFDNDGFGQVQIPKDKYWGAQTQRAIAVFSISREKFPPCLIRTFALQKTAAARANQRLGCIDDRLTSAIVEAAAEVRDGRFDDHFPLTVWQTGSGTQTNMNANEVIANRANQIVSEAKGASTSVLGSKYPVHPNDHVNRSQSSNDSFPTVMNIVTMTELLDTLIPSLSVLESALNRKAVEFEYFIKIGRTHLMDAVPMTMGQSFDAFARQIGHHIDRIRNTFDRLRELPQGGTAVGSGINVPPGFDSLFLDVSGVLNGLATSLLKIATDLRFLGSGPRCGLAEIVIPRDGLTSSIMPGKRNPTLAEVMSQIAFQVMGNHTTVTVAGAAGGHFELNVAKPVIIYNVLQSIELLTQGVESFTRGLVEGLKVDKKVLKRNVDNSLLLVTALNPVIGYDAVCSIVNLEMEEDLTPKEAALRLELVAEEVYDAAVNPAKMIGLVLDQEPKQTLDK